MTASPLKYSREVDFRPKPVYRGAHWYDTLGNIFTATPIDRGAHWYETTYRNGDSVYGGKVWANSLQEAQDHCVQRGLGERVQAYTTVKDGDKPYVRPSDLIAANGDSATIAHALCWLGDLAISSDVCSPSEVLGDNGFFHLWAHHKSLKPGTYIDEGIESIIRRVKEVEEKIPGFVCNT